MACFPQRQRLSPSYASETLCGEIIRGKEGERERGGTGGLVSLSSSLLPAPSTTLLAAIDCSQCAAVMKGLSTFLRPREVKRDARSSITRCPSTLPIVFRILVKTVSAQHSSATVPRRRPRGSQHARRHGAVCGMASFERPLRASPCTRCSFCAQPERGGIVQFWIRVAQHSPASLGRFLRILQFLRWQTGRRHEGTASVLSHTSRKSDVNDLKTAQEKERSAKDGGRRRERHAAGAEGCVCVCVCACVCRRLGRRHVCIQAKHLLQTRTWDRRVGRSGRGWD